MRVEVLTLYQRVSAEIQVRGRLLSTLNDPELTFQLRNVASEPFLPGAPRLQNIPAGLFRKPMVGAVVPLEQEPPPSTYRPRSSSRRGRSPACIPTCCSKASSSWSSTPTSPRSAPRAKPGPV